MQEPTHAHRAGVDGFGRRALIFGALLSVVLFMATPARAEITQARVDAAAAAYERGEYLHAYDEFLAMHLEAGDHPLRWELLRRAAICQEKVGHLDDALATYERLRDLAEDADRQTRAEAKIAELESRLFGAIELQCSIQPSTVQLEGLGAAIPCPGIFPRVRAGTVVAIATAKERTSRALIEVVPGRTVRETIVFTTPRVVAKPAAEGGPVWPWIAGGVAVAAAATVAIVLLASGDEAAPEQHLRVMIGN